MPDAASPQAYDDAALQSVIAALAAQPKLPSAEELYDALMGIIEPDLKRDNVAAVQQPRPGESPEDTAARQTRYNEAFAQYEKALGIFTAAWSAARRGEQRTVLASIEEAERTSEGDAISQLEQSLNAAA